MRPIHAATACFPGFSPDWAVGKILAGVFEPGLGAISASHIQLCPQTPGQLTEKNCCNLMEKFPETQFRLHANARVLPDHYLFDVSTFNSDTVFYYKALAARSHCIKAPAYSLHSGYQEHCSLNEMLDKARRIQELFGEIPVAIEGLYPNSHRPQLVDSWTSYEALLDSGLNMAIDMSHLQIVAHKEGWQEDLVRAMLASPQCLEVHVSDNDGRRDQHKLLKQTPSWFEWLEDAHSNAVFFSEGDQVRGR